MESSSSEVEPHKHELNRRCTVAAACVVYSTALSRRNMSDCLTVVLISHCIKHCIRSIIASDSETEKLPNMIIPIKRLGISHGVMHDFLFAKLSMKQ